MKKRLEESLSDRSRKISYSKGLPVTRMFAAGIDIGDTFHEVAVSSADGFEVRRFPSFTRELLALVQWLVNMGITTVAMESTGIYWLNLYVLLEEAGIEPYLVNAKHAKNVTGRKKDDTDAIWLQKLHSCGLLQKSFQPSIETRKLRTYVRHRRDLLERSSSCVLLMQKALELMNIKIHTVISDILGKTGISMVQAILEGKRGADELLQLKDGRIQASDEAIRDSLQGIWREEYLFLLEQAYDGYLFLKKQVVDCEQKIEEQLLLLIAEKQNGDITGFDTGIKKKPRKNQLHFNARDLLATIAGVDLCQIEGMSEVNTLEFISETGTDMSQWASSKHFAAWLNLAPNTKITGGKIISSKMQRKKNHAGQTLRMAASTLCNCKRPMGDYARKMRSRLGKRGGVVATAHKLARVIYVMLQTHHPYDNKIIEETQNRWKNARVKYLEKQIAQLKKTA